VSRIVAAAIEQHHDERGIVWPAAMAPFQVAVCPIGAGKSPAVREAALALHDELEAAGVEVLLDDRDERPGVMFADMELIGLPARVVIGDRGLKQGQVEFQRRRDTEARMVPLTGAAEAIRSALCAD
jgi:prolyl-tRNA synthetase